MKISKSVPFYVQDVTPAFLTKALRESGILDEAEVTNVDAKIVGTGAGFIGEVALLSLKYDKETTSPKTIALKIPTQTKNRKIGQALGVYEKEIRVYSELGPDIPIRIPTHYYSAVSAADDPELTLVILEKFNRLPNWLFAICIMLMTAFVGRFKRKYILLIEDIAKYRIGDQINGCSTDDARHAISSLATLHAHYWESAKLRETAWIVPFSMTARFTHMMYLSAYKKFKEQNKDWLDVRQNDMLDWLSNNALLLMKKISKVPLTLNHGDFRLDNLCFDDEHGEVIVFDWQTPVRGPGTFDLAYFLSNSCKVSEAPALIKYYQDQMASRGIDIDTEELKWQFDASMMLMLHRVAPFFYQDMLDFGDERGAILMTNWVKAIYSQLDDVDYKNLV